MAKRPRSDERGNDLLFKPRGRADEFDYVHSPFGVDMHSTQGRTDTGTPHYDEPEAHQYPQTTDKRTNSEDPLEPNG